MPSKTSSPRHSRLSYLVNSTSMIPSVMTLRVEVHYMRVILGTLVALAFVSSIVLVFHHGVEIEARDYASEGKLIDDYNSYSSIVVSAFGRPLELFIELVVQLFVLRFASSSILQPETPWHIRGGVVCSAAALAYLVNNGFNALNAQLRPPDIQPVISAADLSVAMNNNDSWDTDEITNVSRVVSEATPGNPISNTVLRNLVSLASGRKTVGEGLKKDSSSNKTYEFEVQNLRKIYSFTVGRLEWKLEDLSKTFSAKCNVQDGAKCAGLQHLLSEKTSRLVASADDLPLGLLAPFPFDDNAIQRILALVRIQEPSASAMTTTSGMYEVASGDILFPRNVDSMTSDASVRLDGSLCVRWVKDRLHSVLNNHFYIEHTLQPAYTAAMLFLFQDATTKVVLTLSNNRESLKFSQNIQRMAVRLSIPPINMILSLVGCVLCGLGVFGALLYPAFTTKDPLQDIDSAHVIAHVMLDESKFPPLILRRHLVDLLDDHSKRSEVEAFVIQALALAPQEYHDGKARIHFGIEQRETRDSSNSLVVDLE
ncbi:hypothetical protein Poli38472_007062 [Pythium oligandrum]|uniref:Uncharacterized protein n=1 Tax=Pythium oligandrum TaxID=41045 RepID=A0A8K1CAJ9_PYTOL|nr:hypothetical protein Poli38472_007062 [Pythium oligandrum]|eukprot:TMW58917.1 hypothetical protein Poli38472_007062 [Pythium oligandrum]